MKSKLLIKTFGLFICLLLFLLPSNDVEAQRVPQGDTCTFPALTYYDHYLQGYVTHCPMFAGTSLCAVPCPADNNE